MNDRRRLINSAVIATVTALVVFLPHLIRAPLIFPLVVQQLNRHLPGELEVQSCSLSWFAGASCEGVRYTDSRRALGLQLPRIRTDKGLATLLLAPQYLGEFTLSQPSLVFLQPSGGEVAVPDSGGSPPAMSDRQTPVSWWEQRSLRLNLNGGRILAEQGAENVPRVLARELTLRGDLSQGTVTYTLDCQSSQTTGQFHAQGFLNLPIAGQPFFPSLISQATLDVRSMEIEPLLELAASRLPTVPRGRGTLNAACRLHMTGIDDLEVEGMTSLQSLELTGGFLGEDQPRLDQARLTFKGSRHPLEGWRLSQLDLRSEPLSFSARGLLNRQRIDFSAQGEADLPQLSGGLPHLFAIHEQTTIRQGKLRFALTADGAPDKFNVKADCSGERLAVVQAGRPYAWDEPLTLHAAATAGSAGVHFSLLNFQAPFLAVEGQGGTGDFSLKATAELDRLFTELKKIFTLDVQAQGRLQLALGSNRIDPNQLRLRTELTIDNFGVKLGDQPLMPVHPFTLRGELVGSPWFLPQSGLYSLQLAVTAWPGAFDLEAAQLQAEAPVLPGKGMENCRIRTALDLERLATVGRALGGLRDTLHLQGLLQMEAQGVWHRAQLHLRQLTGELKNLVVAANGAPLIREPRVELGLEEQPLHLGALRLRKLRVVEGEQTTTSPEQAFCQIDLAPFALDLQHLRLRAPGKVLEVQGFFGSRHEKPHRAVLELRGLGGLHLLTPWWRQQGWLDGNVDAAGQATAALILRPTSGESPQPSDFSLTVQDLRVKQGKKVLLADPKVDLGVHFLPGSKGGEATKITRLDAQSSLFSFSGTGLAHTRKRPHLLELQGELQPRSAALQQLITSLVPGELSLQGVGKGTMLMSAPLHLPVDVKQVTLSGHLPLEGLRYQGVVLPAVHVPVELNRGTLELWVKGEISGGQVSLHPQWHQLDQEPALRLEPDSQVLHDVPITRAVLNLLPPLGCLVQAQGTIDLQVTRFHRPLTTTKRQADFAVVIDLENARPQAVQAFKQLLETAGLAEGPLRFRERQLACEGWNGAITCAPLRLAVGDRDIRISGSRRRNGTISYKVELPVNEQLARQAGVTVYGDFAATAEIGGTQAAPVFDQTQLLSGLAAQITAALPKPLADDPAQPGVPQGAVPAEAPSPVTN